MVERIGPEDMSLVPTGNMGTRQWADIRQSLGAIEMLVQEAKDAASVASFSLTPTPEADVRKCVADALRQLEKIAVEIASADLQAAHMTTES